MQTTILSPGDLYGLLGRAGLVIVDCRFSLSDSALGAKSYEAGHIVGAYYAHLERDLSGAVELGRTGRHPLPDPGTLATKLRSWGTNASSQIVAYDDAGGAIAARLWWLGRWLGHDAVAVLDGGYPAWVQAGYPVTDAVPPEGSGTFEAKLRQHLTIDAAEVERIRHSATHRLFDARSADRFRGEVEPIDPVAGHIPGAHSLPFADNLESGRFRAPAALHARFKAALGDVPVTQGAVYCGSGVTACHDVLAAAHGGLDGLKLYAGSWSEWIINPQRPVARGDD